MKTNTLRNLMFIGVVALPVAALAGVPQGGLTTDLTFGASYTFENGTIDGAAAQVVNYNTTVMADNGWTIGANPILDDGFAQYTITDQNGDTFFHTIIGGGLAQGNNARGTIGSEYFDTESFVKIGAAGGQGIAVNQIVDDLRGGDFGTLASSSVILTGSDFLDGSGAVPEASVVLTQTVTDFDSVANTGPAISDAPFDASFGFKSYLYDLDGDGDVDDIVGLVDLGQTIDPGDSSFLDSFAFKSTSFQNAGVAAPVVQSATVDIQTLVNLGSGVSDQDFQYDKRSGLVSENGTLSAAAIAALIADEGMYAGVTAAGSGQFNGSPPIVDWVVGDTIDRVLIDQAVPNAGDFGFGSFADRVNVAGNPADTDAVEYISEFSLASSTATPIDYVTGVDPF